MIVIVLMSIHLGLGFSSSFSEFSNITYGFIPCFILGIDGKEKVSYFIDFEFFGDRGEYTYSHLGEVRKLRMSFYGFLLKAGTDFSEDLPVFKNLGMGLMLGWIKEKRQKDFNSSEYIEGSGSAPGIFLYFKTDKKEILKKIKINLKAEMSFVSFRTIKTYYDYLSISGISLNGIKMNLIFYYE